MSGPAAGRQAPAPGAALAGAPPPVDALQLVGEDVYWLEGRGGGAALVRRGREGVTDALPAGVRVGSRVHEYGGGAYWVADGVVWFVNAADQQIWRADRRGLRPVTTAPGTGEHRYADLRPVPGGLLVAVRERHEDGIVNELVMLRADGSELPRPVAHGWDFYSFPRPSPDGRLLAWTTWRHPLMPWDGSWLWVAEIGSGGTLGEPRQVAGGPQESVFQPEWSHDGVLHVVSDRSGWWDLYTIGPGGDVVPVAHVDSAELGVAQWEFGYATYAFLDGGRIALLAQHGGSTRLHLFESDRAGGLRPIELPCTLPYTSIKPYLAADHNRVAFIGSGPAHHPVVAVLDLDHGTLTELSAPTPAPSTRAAPDPEPIEVQTQDGTRVYATLYRPHPPKATQPSPPPVIVRAHPGPTSNAPTRLDPWVLYFVGHGFAILDVDYRGSTGYGRAYRNALRRRWGLLDVADCIEALAWAGHHGLVDPTRAVISGASAGSYTALRAATTTGAFRAATVRSAVADPATWQATAPKFQQHHADLLLGPAPAARERSLLRPGSTARCPILALHGDQDPVTPLSQARALAATLGETVSLIVYPGEGHGLNHPENLDNAAAAELAHYRAALER